ncbi:ATP-binding protein, partial [Streptomyces sp. SID12488]|uniref:AAA family ATPase n=1 Tax=Streptomyces sp. SID12488 TaxID=2706040 RepID=UPI0013DA8895|nr:ATP-binding protein [Streptomyces sp. SID12488]
MTYTLRGRKTTCDRVADALAGAADGHGRVVLIEGAAGSGRSRMLAETAALASDRGFTVCQAVADHVGHPAFLAPLGLAPLPPVGEEAAAAGPGDLSRFAARLLERPLRTPVLVALDDVQGARPADLEALRSLSALLATRALPVLVVVTLASRGAAHGTCRPVPDGTHAAVDRLVAALAADSALRLDLPPLPEPAVAALAAEVLGAPPDVVLARLLATSGGA